MVLCVLMMQDRDIFILKNKEVKKTHAQSTRYSGGMHPAAEKQKA
jgi:hypothetical protein